MTPTQVVIGILALVIALPGACNALVSLYDRFLAKPGQKPMALSGATHGIWAIRLFNVIGLVILAVVVAQTWFVQPAQPPQNAQPETHGGFGFNTAPPPSGDQRQVGETFSIQLAQLLASLPKPCLIRLTGGSSTPTVEQTILWVINYGNIPSGSLCSLDEQRGLPSADEPELKHTNQPGIIVHWKEGNLSGEKIAHFLDSMGLNVSSSHHMGQSWPQNLVWLDIGNGYPWK
jgi:hypothetical protein